MKCHKVPWHYSGKQRDIYSWAPPVRTKRLFSWHLWWPPESFCSLAASNALGAYVHACFEGHMHKKSGRTTNKNASTMHCATSWPTYQHCLKLTNSTCKKKPNPRPQSRHSFSGRHLHDVVIFIISEANTWNIGWKAPSCNSYFREDCTSIITVCLVQLFLGGVLTNPANPKQIHKLSTKCIKVALLYIS